MAVSPKLRLLGVAASLIVVVVVLSVAVVMPAVSSARRASEMAVDAAVAAPQQQQQQRRGASGEALQADAAGPRGNGSAPGAAAAGNASSSSSSSSSNMRLAALPPEQPLLPEGTPECNGVAGLCSVPVRLVTFPGTHNSMAVRNREFIAESQKLGFREQLEAGARIFDLDYAGGSYGPKLAHCFSCFCSLPGDPADADPAQVFGAMAEFLAAHPREVLVVGLSNIQCGDKAEARRQLLELLAASPLTPHLATAAVGPEATLGELVESGQRAVLLFYDEWTTPAGYRVGEREVPSQPLLRVYGEGTTVDASGAAAMDSQLAQRLLADVRDQVTSGGRAEGGVDVTFRVLGLFPSACLGCRSSLLCGLVGCAMKANSEPHVLYLLARTTADWLAAQPGAGQRFVTAFNAFQADYMQVSSTRGGLVAAARRLNRAFAWMYGHRANEAAQLGLGSCAWVLDEDAFAGGLACVHDGQVPVDALLGLGGGAGASGGAAAAEAGDAGGDAAAAAAAAPGAAAAEPAASGAGTDLSSVLQSIAGFASNVFNSTLTAISGGGRSRRLLQEAPPPATAGASSSSSGSSRSVLLPANPALQLQLFAADGKTLRWHINGVADRTQLVPLGAHDTLLQVVWL